VIAWDFIVTSALVAGSGGEVVESSRGFGLLGGVRFRSSNRRRDDIVT